jgi:hypothetical protein
MGHQCTSTVPAGQDLLVNSYSLNGMTFVPSFKTIPQISKTVVVNDGIPIMWQASDSAVLARATIMSSTPEATTSVTPTASPAITDTVIGRSVDRRKDWLGRRHTSGSYRVAGDWVSTVETAAKVSFSS